MNANRMVFSCLALLCAPLCHAQSKEAESAKPREFREFVGAVPKQELLKLRGNTQAEAATAVSKLIGAAELNKAGTFRVTVANVVPWIYPGEGFTGYRVGCKNEMIKESSVTFDLLCWIYTRQGTDEKLEKMRSGKDLIVTGVVTRAEVVIDNGRPRLSIDIQATGVKQGK